MCKHSGFTASLVMWLQVLVEQSLLGWKEFELEVMRDTKDNVVIICSIENVDPMGVHTGDSITIAPAQTLTDKEYQRLRDAAVAIIREMGVETGECHQTSEVRSQSSDNHHQTTVIRRQSSDIMGRSVDLHDVYRTCSRLDIAEGCPASISPWIGYCNYW